MHFREKRSSNIKILLLNDSEFNSSTFVVLASIALASEEAVMEESEISWFSIPKGVIHSEKILNKVNSPLKSQVELNAVITTATL